LMDCQMPNVDGYQATEMIRAGEGTETGRRMTIIAVTANASKDDRERCLACGMDDYLSKPLTIKSLQDVLLRYYGQKDEKPSPVLVKYSDS